ncbi:MAG TPA: hypothetical protein VNE38_20295 [Ktedonobacteraceae bacterium]|nr:hypothetical protein [Ktedonobacteraceae bacterium]HVB75898.1 hypothetical protein [Ktedonobacteraceae bacterium]
MDKREQFEGTPDPRQAYLPLAQWLQMLLTIPSPSLPPQTASPLLDGSEKSTRSYHLPYYQQLPDFAMALLNNDSQASARYAPLIYHLIGCAPCHQAYLEIYDALRAALTDDNQPIVPDTNQHALALTPARMIVHLCQLLINQAQEVLLMGRRNDVDNDAWARVLLQQSLLMSTHIMQSVMRQRALQNLVDVAMLATESTSDEQGPAIRTYSSLVLAGSGARKGKTRRRAELVERPAGEPAIELQSGTLEGLVTQHDDILELRLRNLDESLRGRYVLVAVPLGSIIEPVRWLGGNPRAIRSQSPVSAQGDLATPLGRTDLRLTSAEDRNLLEAMFKKLDIRPLDL